MKAVIFRGEGNLDYAWTTGNDRWIVHHRIIDRGASSEVHEVSCQVFLTLKYNR